MMIPVRVRRSFFIFLFDFIRGVGETARCVSRERTPLRRAAESVAVRGAASRVRRSSRSASASYGGGRAAGGSGRRGGGLAPTPPPRSLAPLLFFFGRALATTVFFFTLSLHSSSFFSRSRVVASRRRRVRAFGRVENESVPVAGRRATRRARAWVSYVSLSMTMGVYVNGRTPPGSIAMGVHQRARTPGADRVALTSHLRAQRRSVPVWS